MKKNSLLAALAVAAVLSPAFGEDAGKKLRIVFCPPNMKHTWNVAAAHAAETDAKKLGIDIIKTAKAIHRNNRAICEMP
jgi:ABC-type sugar transport system substrate-binding protein